MVMALSPFLKGGYLCRVELFGPRYTTRIQILLV